MRTLFVAASAALIASVTTAGAFFTFDWPTFDTYQFKISAYGWDVRVYEWNSPSDRDVMCAAGFADAGPIGLQCWKTGMNVEPNSNN